MIIRFSGPLGGFRTGAEQVLLLRDNVQHHLQGGVPSPEYPRIHAMADVVFAAGPATFPAADLWSELTRAFRRLEHLEYRELAMSIRTRAILTHTRALPAVRGTALVRMTGWRVPMATAGVSTLGELFQSLLTRLDIFTDAGRAPWNVEIRAESGAGALTPTEAADRTEK